MYLTFVAIIIIVFGVALVKINEHNDDHWGPILVACFFISLFNIIIVGGSYMGQISNVGTVKGQHHVITVQQERIDSLQTRLTALSDPMGDKQILLNADSPFTSLITELANAEADLAKAKTTKASALVSIEKRKLGPFWFITKLVPVD